MYTPVIGLEIHVELKTKSKMFCSCLNDSDEKHPNVNVCPVCMAHPGTLPVINEEAVKKVIKTGIALNSVVSKNSKFDRKNYFYPDLPKGYQISQYNMPFCKGGFLNINNRKINITRVHLEEDTGKLVHKKECSLVDFNRAGIPLMELVTEPDITSAKEARKFAEELRMILRYLGVSEANMEKGQMRVEANISLKKGNKLGTKVEIKNLNSFRSVEYGIDYEISRQSELLKSGKKIVQETRGWHDSDEITFSQREKEESHDYRYFPEPDLPPLSFNVGDIQKIKAEIPELSVGRRDRFKKEYKIGDKEIEVFVKNKELGEYFEKVVSEIGDIKLAKLASNYLITDLQGLLKGMSIEKIKITPEDFAKFIVLISQGEISSKTAKVVLKDMFSKGIDPVETIKKKGLIQVTDEKEVEKAVKQVIDKNSKAVEDFKRGKQNALQFLMGQVMAQTKGKANPEIVNKVLKKLLGA